MDGYKIGRIHFVEKIVTKAMNGCKRSIIELYMIMPELFIKGTRTYTILEPKLYEANKVK